MGKIHGVGAALLIAFAGCTDAGQRGLIGPDGAQPHLSVSSVNVCCQATVYQGVSYQVYADVYDQNNQRLYNQVVGWSTSGNGVAAIYGSTDVATVQAVGVGTTTIYANVGGVIGYTTLTVRAAPVLTTIQIQNAPISVQLGSTRAVTAKAYDQYGNQMTGVTFSWSVQNTSIATVNSSGTVTPVSAGTTTITASSGGKSASAQLTVTPALSVSISGPGWVNTPGEQTWTATATGGNGTVSYRWWVEWNTSSTLDELTTGSTASLYVDQYTPTYFILYVEATSGTATASAQVGVCNFTASAGC